MEDLIEPQFVQNLAASSVKTSKYMSFSPSFQRFSITSWITENIKKKECQYYTEHSSKGRCHCGYLKEFHSAEALKSEEFLGETWKLQRHVREAPTDAFGEITFTGVGQKVGKFVRVSSDTSPETLYQLVTEYWNLSPPNLLISVTGGAKNFYMKAQLKSMFRRGLIKVAHTTGAWILTGGTNTGVMKHVGTAVQDYTTSTISKDGKIVTIGIATWGTVHNRQYLVDPEGKFPGYYPLDVESQGRLSCLDINHSHFILVDNGTHGSYGVEIALRSKLEKFISMQPLGKIDGGVTIPVVCVVLEGGPGTLDTIYNAMINGTPCVILEGSGRVADVIAQVANLPVSQIRVSVIKKQLKRFFTKEYDTFDEVKIITWTKKIQDIIRMRQLLTVFRIDEEGHNDVDVAILQALLKASKTSDSQERQNWARQLELAVGWNRVDIAKSEIFTEDRQWKSRDLHPAMLSALIGDKAAFVKLLLENGVCLNEFMIEQTLLELYNHLQPSSLILHKIAKRLKTAKHAGRITLGLVSDELRQLLGSFTQPLYPKPAAHHRFEMPPSDIRITVPTNRKFDLQMTPPVSERTPEKTLEDPARDLFIWAILQNRRELAEIFWEQCKDCIAAALAASRILKKLAEEEEGDKSNDMRDLADHYEKQAIGVFTECYTRDNLQAEKLLIRPSQAWGGTTCLRLALQAKNTSFVAQGGVQAFMTKMWFGELAEDTTIWKVLLCMLFFPLIYTGLITFRQDEEIQRKQERKEDIDNMESMALGPAKLRSHICLNQEQIEQQPLTCLTRLLSFFSCAVVKFYWNIISYFIFLCLFAYTLMMNFQVTPSGWEILLYVWLLSLVFEEIRQLFNDPDGFRFRRKAKIYISDIWNKLDVLAIFIFISGLACRLTTAGFYVGKIILCFDFIIFCLRLMAIFAVSRTLGPKIIIVKRMMKDMFFFMFLLAVFVLAYGVAKHAIRIENEDRLDWILRGVVYEPYLTIFGLIPSNIDNVGFDITKCTLTGSDPLMPRCPVLDSDQTPAFPVWLTTTLLCVYLLFANILLLNLLVAMLSYTFQEVQDNTDQIWKFQRYELIKEYHSRPPAPPPLIILSHLFLFLRCLILRKHKQIESSKWHIEEEELLSWEAFMKENFLANQCQAQSQSTENMILDTAKKVGVAVDLLESEQGKDSASMVKRLDLLEKQVAKSNIALQWIVNALQTSVLQSSVDAPMLLRLESTEADELEPSQEARSEKPQQHVNATHLIYPSTTETRFPVPEEYVPWEVKFPLYKPTIYNDSSSRRNTDIVQLDKPIADNFRNPVGRTGIEGKGSLYRLGPNQAIDPVITRWKKLGEASVLEFIAVREKEDDFWSFPGGVLQPDEDLPKRLNLILSKKLKERIADMLRTSAKMYEGYVDDCRNTDNAWVETTAFNLHFEGNDVAHEELSRMGSAGSASGMQVQWQEVNDQAPLCAYQKDILQTVADLHHIQP
ncbi:transient receptor potential cation channel subfamily M member 2 [Amia ocellicauda]|uniref:transient receptor potential cation channel subfamily M member 2 n=1 Tax=Amia ocellicauda TaxID=2972642 RepID=UPI003463F916